MTTIVDAPARVDDLQLIGAMPGSGYRTPPALVRRGDGQTLQLTPLLYLVLEAVDGQRSCAEIADLVSRATGRGVSEDAVATLVDDHLRPLGLLKLADGSEAPLKRSNPLLSLKLKFAVTNPRYTRRLTDPFRILFRPMVAVAVVTAFLAVTWWVFFEKGLAPAAYDAFQRPQLLLLVFVVTVLSAGFHEFGHAAAARYGGADPGVMGAGLYLVWPAFYTDVTDSYRLARPGRIRTDLGGLYFNAMVVVVTFGWWFASGWDALLLVVATQILQMVHQLMPLMRFDGYHLLADLTGVPDLYHRIRPTLAGLLPHRWSDPKVRALKPWARAVITLWVLITVPMLVVMLAGVVAAVPRMVGSAGAAVQEDAAGVQSAWQNGGFIDTTASVLQVLSVVLPMLACALILGRIGLRSSRGLTKWSRGSFPRRVVAAALSTLAITGLAWAWWPQPGTYRPIGPDEKGLITSLLPTAQSVPAARSAALPATGITPIGASAEQRLAGGEPLAATFPEGKQLPSESDPQLAMVLVPSGNADPNAGPNTGDGQPAPADDSDEPWVFPFDQPLPPGEGDNQAAAYNTTDDSTVYDVAFALVWANGDEVLNVNEAHAYASCANCVTVAVAFQVVLIMDNAHVVVPQNLAVAANYQCYRCITAAIASQLVLSVEDTPGEAQLLALGDVWNRLTEFGRRITTFSLAEISAQLQGFKEEIAAILNDAPPVSSGAASSDTGTQPGSSGAPDPGSSPTGSEPSSAPSSPASSAEPSESASPSPTSEPTTEPTTAPPTEPTPQATEPAPSPTP